MNGGFIISNSINSSLILIWISLTVPNDSKFIYPKPIPIFKTGEKVPEVVIPISLSLES
jgi:hypothetical protein